MGQRSERLCSRNRQVSEPCARRPKQLAGLRSLATSATAVHSASLFVAGSAKDPEYHGRASHERKGSEVLATSATGREYPAVMDLGRDKAHLPPTPTPVTPQGSSRR